VRAANKGETMKTINRVCLALGVVGAVMAMPANAGIGPAPQPGMPWLNFGQGGISVLGMHGMPNPYLNFGQGGISVLGMHGMPNPYLNFGQGGISVLGMPGMPNPYLNFGQGGISVIGMPGMANPYLNFGQGGISVIGIPGADGQIVPVQNTGGNGGFVAVPAPPAPPQPVLCKLRDQVLIAGAVESCEKAGGKPVAPESTTK
jgi:hypothetical protein